MLIKTVVVGPLAANCYVVGCRESKEAVIIDPGAEPNSILRTARENLLKPKYIINTHGHVDHVSANGAVKEKTGAAILIHKDDAWLLSSGDNTMSMFFPERERSPPPDRLLQDGELVRFGALTLRVIHTPGHTPGGICLSHGKVLFTGDTLFAGGIGRYDLPGGSFEALRDSITSKLFTLEDDVVIYPGHGSTSTIGYEKRYNPFV